MTAAPVGFDLDMTLIDSRRAILVSFAAVADATGVPIDPEAVDRRLGIKLEDELAHWFPADRIEDATRLYREHYVRLAGELTTVLPGARESLAAVRAAGGRVLVVTAKIESSARLSLDGVGLRPDALFADAHPVGVATGSFTPAELRDAGAATVLDSLAAFPDIYRTILHTQSGPYTQSG